MRTDSGWRSARLAWLGVQLATYLATTLVPAHAFPSNSHVGDDASGGSSGSPRANAPTGHLADLGSLLSRQLTSTVTGAASDMLNTLGTTQLDIDFDRHFKVRGGSLDLLVPLHDTKKRLDFMQVGVRHLYDRTTLNVGAGQRYFSGDWMLGLNGFLDIDPARNHRRLGLGVEAWRDYLKLAANGYLRLSDWKNSRLMAGFDERPANGFDVVAEGYLPFYPPLGAKLVYEKYSGNRVDLFARDALRPSRHAMTLGMTYTPVPVLGLSVDRRHGGGQSDTRLGLQMNLQFDRSLKDQLDPSRMRDRRGLTGSRYDLVSRNNRIVMEYREQGHVKIGLPAEVKGLGRQTVPLQVRIESKRPLKHVVWQQGELVTAGGSVVDLGGGNYAAKLPNYEASAANSYVISAVAYDVNGHRSQPATTKVTVTGPEIDVARSSLAADPPVIHANGQDKSVLRIALRDGAGEPVTGMARQFEAVLDETVDTKVATVDGQPAALSGFIEAEPGIYTATLTAAARPGVARIATSVVGTALGEIEVRMIYDSSSAGIGAGDLTVDKHVIVANGADTVTYTAVVRNAFGAPARDTRVSWATDYGVLSSASSMTDAEGVAMIRLTSTVTGTAQVTAQVGSQAAVNAPPVTLASDHSTAMIGNGGLTVDKTALTAGTTDTATYTAIVKDAQGHLVVDATVNWHTNLGQLGASSSSTDTAGAAMVALTSTTAGIAQVTAQVGSRSAVDAPSVTIHSDSASAAIGAGDLTVNKGTIAANGADAATYRAIVKDAFGNPVPQIQVGWATDVGRLSGASSMTDAAGVATISLTSTVTGTAQVTAQVGSQAAVNAPPVTLASDHSTAMIGNGGLTVDKTALTAGTTDTATYTAIVKDAQGHLVVDATVNWHTNLGQLGASSSTTDTAGAAMVALTSTTAGIAQVTAQVGSQSAVDAPSVTIHSDSASAGIGAGDLTVNKGAIVANGADAATYRAIVKDAFGNPVPQIQVGWATDVGRLSGTSSMTDAAGVAMIRLTSTVLGTAQVTAQVGSQAAVNAPAVAIVFDPATVRLRLDATKTKITGTRADDSVLTATLTDANNNPAAQQTVTWTTTAGSLSAPSSVTDANGRATVTFNAVVRTASNIVANIQAAFASVRQARGITVRAVHHVGGHDYWTMYSDLDTNAEATAVAYCAAHGGGTVATRNDLAAFAAGNGNFYRMSVSGEFADRWYRLRGSWGVTAGDFGNPGVGDTTSGGEAYVCVK